MKSIRKQMLAYLIFGTIVIFTLLFIFSNFKLKELPEHFRNQYSEIVKSKSYEVSKEFQGLVEQITIISKSPVIRSMDLDKIRPYFTNLVLEGKYRNLTIAYPDGEALTTLGDSFNISEQDQYKQIFIEKKEYVISQPFRSPFVYESNNEVVIVSHSVKNDNGEIVGLINGVIRVDFINQIVKDLDLGDKGYGWIVNKDGLLVAYPDLDVPLDKNIRDFIDEENVINQVLKEDYGVVRYIGKNNESELAFFSNIIGSPDWVFVVSIPEGEIYNEVNHIRNAILSALVFGLIVVIIFSFHYSSIITRPILDLKDVFEKATYGNLDVVANEHVPNELGLAASSFNVMLDRIKILTYSDLVTDLYNYNGFLLKLPNKTRTALKKGKEIAIIIISIDDFKRINSIHGYEVGDEVLREFAIVLRDFVKSDEIAARFLGDEFILFVQNEKTFTLEKRIELLWKLCNREIKIRDSEFFLKTSIGVSFKKDGDLTVEEVINQATIAKLVAKKMGGNNYKFYNYELDELVREEQKMENALYHAVENDELMLLYQPIIDLVTEEIVGTEALLRWDHPEYRDTSPLVIIKIAEQINIIGEIGQWVLQEACRQNKSWHDKGYTHLVVSVNVSALQFDQWNFVNIVKQVLKDTGLNPRFLELEVTETIAMDRVEDKLSKMESLKDMGVRISIDDFGTGYSSLAYFTRFPIDTLKIDKSFVKNMYEDENSKNIITTIINMAKSLKIELTAEGVETQEQLELLNKMGCDKIQGYLFSRPVLPKELLKMLAV
ncbi:MAG: EAL domain-containing protein [Tissierellaceae bacterium]|nr:EAL domain-containing protein [Tissierellaceae bacterium]